MKIKPIPKLLTTVVFTLISTLSMAQFPYFQSFKDATATNIVFGGAPTAILTAAQGIDLPGDGYLRLTNNTRDQRGYIYSTENFPTGTGLSISFEYYTYGGSGADGICFFLFDATAGSNFNIGGFGGSLGYAQYLPYNSSTVLPGLSKGYLGVALDEFGNFSNPIEARRGGVKGPGIYGISPKSVTLRGKGDGADTTSANNYKFLTQVTASDKGVDLVNDANQRFPSSTQIGFRKAYIDLKPNPAGGFNISVRIQVGGSPTKTTTVVDNYYYPEAAPSTVSYGISSSTGDLTNFHEIRNVSINPYIIPLVSPTAQDDIVQDCPSKPQTINIVANDATTNLGGTLDLASIDLDPFDAGVQTSFVIGGRGAFAVNSDGTIKYVPLASTVSGSVSCKYTITDSYGYTSSPATITITEPTNPIQADAGTAQLIHIATATGSASIIGNLPTGATGSWSQVSGPSTAVITNVNSATTTVTALQNGTYTFRWTLVVAGQCDATSNVQIVVNAIPVAVDDSKPVVINTPLAIDVLANDTDRDGNTTIDKTKVIITTNPLHGTVAVDPVTGIVTYTPTTGYTGADSFKYTVTDNKGAVSNIATVNLTIPVLPKIGLAKGLLPLVKQSDGSFNVKFLFTIKNHGDDVLRSISLKDDLAAAFPGLNFTVVSKSSVGLPIFLFNGNYNGSSDTELLQANQQLLAKETAKIELEINVKLTGTVTSFVNTATVEGTPIGGGAKVTDVSTNGTTTDPITPDDVTPAVPTPIDFPAVAPPKIGLAKKLVSLDEQSDKSFNVKFLFTIKNYGDATLQNISLKDDLSTIFTGANYTVTRIASVGSVNFNVNNNFNGTSDTEMLLANNQLLTTQTAQIELDLNVKLLGTVFKFLNTAIATGTPALGGPDVTDVSMDGEKPDPNATNDVTPSDPTPIQFPLPPIFIPEGFSPNGDGTNDFFVIPNGALTPLDLEIYNRWGNVVYKSVNYTNNWDGKSNKGLYVGQDLPSGTYYYIVKYNSQRYVGFITLNR